MEYLCVSSFSFFLSRLVVSTVVTALTVDASQPHYFYTTHTLTTLEYKPQRKKYTRARGKLGLLAASPDSRCTRAACPEPPIDPDPSCHAKTAKKSGATREKPGRAARPRGAAAGPPERSPAANGELPRAGSPTVLYADGICYRRSRRRRSPGPSNPEPRAGRRPAQRPPTHAPMAHHASSPPQQTILTRTKTILTRTKHSPRTPRRFSP